MKHLNFCQAKAKRDELEVTVAIVEKTLRAIPGTGSGAMGLTPDGVKNSPEYKRAKVTYDQAFANLRAFNREFVKMFKAELREERSAKRA